MVFQLDDAIERLNALAAEFVKNQVPLQTTEELLEFFKNPPQRPYSVLREEAMTSVVKMFETADDNGRRSITLRLSVSARNGFLGYSVNMAVLAVRNQSPALIRQGLVALVIEGGSQDYRDSIVALAKLHHSAVKLGMESRRELGLRMALGARASDLLLLVVSQEVVLTMAGALLGAGAALSLTRLLGDLLYKTSPRDPLAFVAAFLVLTVASLAACVGPAWKVTRTDPVRALRD